MGRKEKMKAAQRKINRSSNQESTDDPSVHPALLTIDKLQEEIENLSKYISNLEQNTKSQDKYILNLENRNSLLDERVLTLEDNISLQSEQIRLLKVKIDKQEKHSEELAIEREQLMEVIKDNGISLTQDKKKFSGTHETDNGNVEQDCHLAPKESKLFKYFKTLSLLAQKSQGKEIPSVKDKLEELKYILYAIS